MSGDDAFRRRKMTGRLVRKLQEQKWRIVEFSGEERSQLSKVLTGSSFFRSSSLAVISNPEKVDQDLVLQHQINPVSGVTLLLVQEGSPKRNGVFRRISQQIPESCQQVFKLPPFWKQAEDAAQLCQQEARERGLYLSPELAESLVELVGVDLGLLAQEIYKLGVYLEALGETTITPRHLVDTVTILAESSIQPLLQALGQCRTKKVQACLGRIFSTSASDPTIKTIRFVLPTLTKWVSAAVLHEREMDPEEAATFMGANAWFYKTKLLPPAKIWGSQRLVGLIGDLAETEREVFRGSISPWTGLCVRFLRACQEARI